LDVIYIDDLDKPDNDGIHKTGAIYNFAAPSKIVSQPVGQWNNLEIKVIKQNYTVMINHQKVIEFIGNRQLERYILDFKIMMLNQKYHLEILE
jgi:hypothetical protein